PPQSSNHYVLVLLAFELLSLLTSSPPPRPTLFPYTTLFRSCSIVAGRPRSRPPNASVAASWRSASAPASRFPTTSARAGCALVVDRKSTRLNSSHSQISYAVFCLKKKIEDLRSHFSKQMTRY